MTNNSQKEFSGKFKSDKRQKGGNQEICPLCKNHSLLRLSHIIPKWAFSWAKQEGSIIGSYKSLNIRVIQQDGSKHYLLCDNCEQFLSPSENYIKTLTTGSISEKIKLGIEETTDTIYNTNVEFIQRFVLGLIFKSHYASSAPFHKIRLTEKQVEQIRNRLLTPINDDLEFPIITQKFYSLKSPKVNPKAIIIADYQKTKQGHFYAAFLIGGWEWLMLFNTEKTIIENLFLEPRLRSDGTLPILEADIFEHRCILNKIFL